MAAWELNTLLLKPAPYLQVKVSNMFGVQVVDAIQDLFEKLSGLLLAERLLLSQEVEELSTCHTENTGKTLVKGVTPVQRSQF